MRDILITIAVGAFVLSLLVAFVLLTDYLHIGGYVAGTVVIVVVCWLMGGVTREIYTKLYEMKQREKIIEKQE